jgi:hypothetical protein
MPVPVGVAMHAVPATQIASIDIPVKHAPVDVDVDKVVIIDPATAPAPASIPPGPYR